jgi:hypothetical protein
VISSKYHSYNYKGGDLLPDESSLKVKQEKTLILPPKFLAPRKIDSRDMCLKTDNQGDNPSCAGYTTAGYIEYYNWKNIHYPKQVDGEAIYKEAKKIDGNNSDGTILINAAQASINLGLINGVTKYIDFPSIHNFNMSVKEKRQISIKFALHQFGVVMCGFLITNEWNYVDKKTGLIRNLKDKAIRQGGHAVLLCGYDSKGVYIQNSWGSSWGHYGFAILSWEQFSNQFMYAVIIE